MGKKISHPWLYCGLLVAVWLCMTYISTVRESNQEKNHEGFTTSGETCGNGVGKPKPLLYSTTRTNNNPAAIVSMFPDYRNTEEQIRKDNNHELNVIYVKGANGNPVAAKLERTQNLPTYSTPGSYQYSSVVFVPTYEDAIKLSSVEFKPTYEETINLVLEGTSASNGACA
jgi:hypothetical protein